MATTDLDILRKLQSALAGKADVIPADWKTSEAWAQAWNKSDSHARKLLREGVKSGLLEARQFRAVQGGRLLTHYRAK